MLVEGESIFIGLRNENAMELGQWEESESDCWQ